jgi:probable F420-dependent oxidoreductase
MGEFEFVADFKICIGLYRVEGLLGGDMRSLLDVVRDADQAGIDQVSFPDHVVMGENLDGYPYGEYRLPPDEPWYEPMTMMAAVAAVTQRLRVSTGVLIAPLRPPALLAKQVATLDVLSGGRLDLGVGVGWQREEYAAQGLDYAARWGLLDDGLRACRKLWNEAPTSFESSSVRFERIRSDPQPIQSPIPIWFGVAPSPRQARRIAELGQGWNPQGLDEAGIRAGIEMIREAFLRAGRDPSQLAVRAHSRYELDARGRADLSASIEHAHRLAEIGVTHVSFASLFYAGNRAELVELFSTLADL